MTQQVKTIEPDRVKTLSRRQLAKLGFNAGEGYLILPTAAELLDADQDERTVHVVNRRFQHLGWITLAKAFKL